MDRIIELAIVTQDGIADCRVESANEEEPGVFSVTILYPNIVNGFSRSETYCHDMRYQRETGGYYFVGSQDIHPKILKLEKEISDEINTQLKKGR